MSQNNNKVRMWGAIGLLALLFVAFVGWFLTMSTRLADKVNNYHQEVQNYQTALTKIHAKLGILEERTDWLEKYMKPFDF